MEFSCANSCSMNWAAKKPSHQFQDINANPTKMKLNTFQQKLNHESPYDFKGLKAVFLNCKLKKS